MIKHLTAHSLTTALDIKLLGHNALSVQKDSCCYPHFQAMLMELKALQNDGETLTNSCQSFWGMNSTHQVFNICDDPSEKVWIITCTVNELTNEPQVGIALFHSQYSGFNVRSVTGFSVHLHY